MPGFITMDDRDIHRYRRDLLTFAKRSYPHATKATVNSAAFDAQKEARKGLKRSLTLRNQWTVRSVQVQKATGFDPDKQVAVVGSLADYMADQEFGETITKKGKHGVPIPTSYSAGQGMKRRPRTRLPKRANRLENIRIIGARVRRFKNTRQRNIVAMKIALKSGTRYTSLKSRGGRKGIYRVLGRAGTDKIKGVRMVHDISRPIVVIPAKPWLRPAVLRTQPKIPGMYLKALRQQIRRNRIFR